MVFRFSGFKAFGVYIGLPRRIRGPLKREPLLNPLLALLDTDLIQRVYIPKGPPNPIPYGLGVIESGD